MEEDPYSEIAKTIGKGIDASRDLGKFISGNFGDAFLQIGSSFADKVRAKRFENAMKVFDRVKSLCEERGIESKLNPPDVNQFIPWLDGASFEGEPSLQDMWATLLANSCDSSKNVSLRKLFINILRQLDRIDAVILNLINREALLRIGNSPLDPPLNAQVLATKTNTSVDRTEESLELLESLGLVMDIGTIKDADGMGINRAISDSESNCRLSKLGRRFLISVSNGELVP